MNHGQIPDDSPIRIFVTGGTFDKEYNMKTGELYFKDTHLLKMFALGRCTLDIHVQTLMMLDSLEMEEDDRSLILRNCMRCKEDNIIITHGTDTMAITAEYLAQPKLEKTIVITGAMIPYAFGTSSDGFFNLGAATAFVQALPYGVYVVMNGRVFTWDNVKKNKKTGFFQALDD